MFWRSVTSSNVPGGTDSLPPDLEWKPSKRRQYCVPERVHMEGEFALRMLLGQTPSFVYPTVPGNIAIFSFYEPTTI